MTHEQLQQIRAIVYDAYCEGDTEAEWMLVVIDAELAKPEQEPVGCKHFRYSVDVHEQTGNCYDCGAEGRMRFVVDAPEPQPVAWREKSRFQKYPSYEYNQQGIGEPLYTAPAPAAQREWQGLTPDEINNCAGAEIYPSSWAMTLARAIESKLKEKNHG